MVSFGGLKLTSCKALARRSYRLQWKLNQPSDQRSSAHTSGNQFDMCCKMTKIHRGSVINHETPCECRTSWSLIIPIASVAAGKHLGSPANFAPISFDFSLVCLPGPRWLSGDYWNVDSNIMKWGKHEAGVLWLRWTHVAEICSVVSKVRRNGACANHDVHRHVEASKIMWYAM